jgi:pimeloyl-ACP methyl ester carboxylesterase
MGCRCDWLRLEDGRRLTYSDTGSPGGTPVIYCHGAIGTPLGPSVDLAAVTRELGVRYIAINRPGIGGSDPAPGRDVAAFADYVREFADKLGLGRFAVVGVSAGGPYALGISAALGDRVVRVALCSSLSPLWPPHRTPGMQRRIRVALSILAAAPELCAGAGDLTLPVLRRHPGLLSGVIAAHAAPAERHRVREPHERAAASASFLAAAEGGVRGMIADYLAYARPWGFDVQDVGASVQLWHGLDDPLVPVEHALQLAIALPRCWVFLDPDEGHHFFRSRLPTILARLVAPDPGERAVDVVAARAIAARHAAVNPPLRLRSRRPRGAR